MDWAALLHLNDDELKSLLEGNVINAELYWWASEHLPECKSCRVRLRFFVRQYGSAAVKKIKKIMEDFSWEENNGTVIPFVKREKMTKNEPNRKAVWLKLFISIYFLKLISEAL